MNRRVDQRPFEAALKTEAVTFMPQELRVGVQLGNVSLTVAMLRLMKFALIRTSADRLCVLSGVDYPAQPGEQIRRALAPNVQLIRIERELSFQGTSVHDRRIRHPYFDGVGLLNPREGPASLWPLRRLASGVASQIQRHPPGDLRLYHGSAWCSLTRDAAESILAYIHERPEFLRWCRLARCPEEFVVHSILKSGPFAGQIAQDGTRPGSGVSSKERLHGSHYIDWSGTGWSPKTLVLDDLPRIQASSALFARKMHPVHSRGLLDGLHTLHTSRAAEAADAG